MDIVCENSPSSESISKSNEIYYRGSNNLNYLHEQTDNPNANMNTTCEISLISESISNSYIPNNREKTTETPNSRKRRNSGRITPRYISRNSKTRNAARRRKTTNKSKSIVHDENDPTATKAYRRRNSNRLNSRNNSRTSATDKLTKRKRSNTKSKSFEHGDQIINVQHVKHDFHKLSPPEQRKFMKEMVTEITLRGVLPPEGGTIDKGLKIQNINKCVIQIEPMHGEYFTQGSDM